MLTQRGSKIFKGNVPTTDATVVTRFKKAGAITLAKTNLPEFSAWQETDNLLTGLTKNPWNLDRTPGGSSGGESAAIAAGLSPIGIGSDVAISVRGPAAFTGIVGLKPTIGRIPYTGHWPAALNRYLAHRAYGAKRTRCRYRVFIYARSRWNRRPCHSCEELGPRRRPTEGSPIRVGWLAEPGFGPVDPEVAARSPPQRASLRMQDARLNRCASPCWNRTTTWTRRCSYTAELGQYIRPFVANRAADLHFIGKFYADQPAPSTADYIEAEMKIERSKAAFSAYFHKYDVFLCPVIPFTAPPPGLSEYVVNGKAIPSTDMMRATVPFNLTGLPALSLPFSFSSEKLPINVQLVSRWFDEATILRLGEIIESATNTHKKHPIS